MATAPSTDQEAICLPAAAAAPAPGSAAPQGETQPPPYSVMLPEDHIYQVRQEHEDAEHRVGMRMQSPQHGHAVGFNVQVIDMQTAPAQRASRQHVRGVQRRVSCANRIFFIFTVLLVLALFGSLCVAWQVK